MIELYWFSVNRTLRLNDILVKVIGQDAAWRPIKLDHHNQKLYGTFYPKKRTEFWLLSL
jgi:hypothetical protein